jgi:hypothetical protein
MKYRVCIIRNEKVGCSIHLSGTNKINGLARFNAPGFFVFGKYVRADVRRFSESMRQTGGFCAGAVGVTPARPCTRRVSLLLRKANRVSPLWVWRVVHLKIQASPRLQPVARVSTREICTFAHWSMQ